MRTTLLRLGGDALLVALATLASLAATSLGAAEKPDAVRELRAPVNAVKQLESWTFRFKIDRRATSTRTIDAVAADIQQVTGLQLQWVRSNSRGVVEFSSAQSMSSDSAAAIRSAIHSLDYVAAGVRVSPSNAANTLVKAQSATPNSREAVGFIVKPQWAVESGVAGDAVPSDVLLALEQAAEQPIVEARSMAGGMVVIRFAHTVSEPTLTDIETRLKATGLVEWAQPDEVVQHSLVPNDSLYGLQWNLWSPTGGINAPMAWDFTTGSASVVVAVIDTGAIFAHPDLAGRFIQGYDTITDHSRSRDSTSPNSDASDKGDWQEVGDCGNNAFRSSTWHGTHVAGIIGAASSNGLGMSGIDWSVRIQPVRVLGRCGGTVSDIINGMEWAVGLPVPGLPANPTPARILNMSLGSTVPSQQCSPAYQTAVDDVSAAGGLIIVAAGNNAPTGVGEAGFYEPSGCPGVIAVGATDLFGMRAPYSDYSTQFVVDLSAPGGSQSSPNDPNGVLSTLDTGIRTPEGPTYHYYQGTSQATPHVSGVAALLLAANSSLTNRQIYWTLIDTSRDFNPLSICYRTSLCGWGILNAHAALLRAATAPANGPTFAAISSSVNPSLPSQAFTISVTVSPSNVTGTVTYYLGGDPLPGCTNLALSHGSTGCSFTNYAANPAGYQVQVLFDGDYTHHWAWSPTLTQFVSASGSGTPTAEAVEYYYAAWNYYFETSFPGEIAALDGGAFGGVWQRTGQTFNVWPQPGPSESPTCRFFSTTFAPKSSHFYTPVSAECAAVKTNPNWEFESIAFYIALADANGNCAVGTRPLYRFYNNGMGGAPNHRYTTSPTIFNEMVAQGWTFEGNPNTKVFACVPQ